MDDQAAQIARFFMEAEGERIVRDMAGHLGDQLFETLKRNGMMMRSVAGAVGVLTIAAAQTVGQAHDFYCRSIADDSDGEPPIEAGEADAEAIALLFVGELPPALKAAIHKASAPPPAAERPDEFDIDDCGHVTALPTWQRNNEAIFLRLQLGSTYPTEGEVAAWTDEQAREADVWACAVMLSASDHDDIIVPPRPTFLPNRRWIPGDSIMDPGTVVEA